MPRAGAGGSTNYSPAMVNQTSLALDNWAVRGKNTGVGLLLNGARKVKNRLACVRPLKRDQPCIFENTSKKKITSCSKEGGERTSWEGIHYFAMTSILVIFITVSHYCEKLGQDLLGR